MASFAVPAVLFGAFLLVFGLSERSLRRQGYRLRVKPPRKIPSRSFADTSEQIRVGARVGWSNVTVPLITLVFDHRWARLVGTLPEVWIDRDAVVAVERIRGPLISGVRFASPDGRYDGIVVWSLSVDHVVARLTAQGWPGTSKPPPPPTPPDGGSPN